MINYFLHIHVTNFLIPTNSAVESEPDVFGSLEPESLEKKQGAGAAWKKSQEPEPVKISRLLSPVRR